jgi:hypothetical protein
MGGYFSGRHNGGPVVEDGLKLDLAHCIRKGLIRPGSYVAGTISWTLTRTGEVKANISYEAHLVDPADAWIRLVYTTTTRATAAKVANDYQVRLETTRPNFGGLRWWFLCPMTGRLRLLGRLSLGQQLHCDRDLAARFANRCRTLAFASAERFIVDEPVGVGKQADHACQIRHTPPLPYFGGSAPPGRIIRAKNAFTRAVA